MDRSSWQDCRLVRGLRSIACIVSVLLCTLSVVLWARSYRISDVAHGHFGAARVFKLVSARGVLTFVSFLAWGGDFKTKWGFNRPDDPDRFVPIKDRHAYDTTLGFTVRRASIPLGSSNVSIVSLPHWSLTAITGLLLLALKRAPRRQFSLLNVFVLLTCVAVVLGTFAVLDRATADYERALGSSEVDS